MSWDAQLEAVNEQIAKLEARISALKEELQNAQWATDSATLQRMLSVREQHLERTKFHARFIEHNIAQGCRVRPIPYAMLANICLSVARKTAHGDTAETLRALGSTFAARAAELRLANRKLRAAAAEAVGHEADYTGPRAAA